MQSVLKDKIAVVSGASRGAGRGIAVALGKAGATVYVTGRTVRGQTQGENLPGTVEETAEMVTQQGGVGIPVRCDHTVDAEVAALFERVQREQSRLDLLVNNAWGGYECFNGEQFADGTRFSDPFWQQSLDRWRGMFEAGVRSQLVTSYFAIPLMLPQQTGLIVSTTAWDRDLYLGNLFYDLAKNAVIRLTFGMAQDLMSKGIAAIALAPGFMRTERVLAVHAETPLDLNTTESPEYIGRAVVALAGDPQVIQKSGKVWAVGNLASEYGFTDIDGRRIPAFKIS